MRFDRVDGWGLSGRRVGAPYGGGVGHLVWSVLANGSAIAGGVGQLAWPHHHPGLVSPPVGDG